MNIRWNKVCLILGMAIAFAAFADLPSTLAQQSLFKVELPTEDQASPVASFVVELSPQTAKPGDTVTVSINAAVINSWHIYPIQDDGEATDAVGLPTEIRFAPIGLDAIDEKFLPNEEVGEYHEGKFGWTRRYKVVEGAESFYAEGSIKFQACDATKCVPPKKLKFEIGIKPASAMKELASEKSTGVADSITLQAEPCRLTRPQAKIGSIAAALSQTQDRLSKRFTINVQETDVAIYLPKEKKYSIENTDEDETRFGNTSTYLSIDQNRDGILHPSESAPANLPIRILDTMFQITEIAKDGSSLSLKKIDVPLHGTVLNRVCPEFAFQTVDGKTITDKSILGKVTILDIWAVT